MKAIVKSAARAFEVLELFRELKRPLRVRDVAEQLGYPSISASGLLNTIADLGYISYDRDKHAYFPTLRFLVLGEWFHKDYFHNDGLFDLLSSVADQTKETVWVTTINDI